MSESYTAKDLSAHSKPDSLWIVVEGGVYDLTKFQGEFEKVSTLTADEHPGGKKILSRVGGKDATKQFWKYHNEAILKKWSPKLKIGTYKDEAKL